MPELNTLVENVIKGDKNALETLIDEFQSMAVNYAWSFTGDYHIAQDLAQEAFIQVIRSIGSLNNPSAFPLWFKTILRFTCIRHIRKSNPVPVDYDALTEEQATDQCPENKILHKETTEHIWDIINNFHEVDRSILVLYHFEDLSYKEIANFLGITEMKVTNRLHTLRGKLKKKLAGVAESEGIINKTDFKQRVIRGVKKIGYVPENGPSMLTQFCGSLFAALSAIGAQPDIDYTYIAAVSGASFRMLWKEGWHPDNVDIMLAREDSFEPMKRAFAATGCTYEIFVCKGDYNWSYNNFFDTKQSDEKQTRKNIMKSIDSGFPVLALGIIGPPECCIVTGYEEGGDVLTGYNYFQNHVNEDGLEVTPDGVFHKRNWYRSMPAYMIIKDMTPVSDPLASFYRNVLKLAVELARAVEVSGRSAGLAAYSAMARQLLHDEEYTTLAAGDGNMVFSLKEQTDFSIDITGRFGMYCDPFLMICERKNAAIFLRRIAEILPEHSSKLLEASEYYVKIAADPNPLWQRLGLFENAQERFRDPDVRSILAGQVLRIQILEEKAVNCLEQVIKSLEDSSIMS